MIYITRCTFGILYFSGSL